MTDPRMQTHYDRTGQTGASLRAHLLGVVHDRLDVNPGHRCDLCYSDHPCNCPDEWVEDLLAAIERWEFHAGPKPWETRVGPKVVPDPNLIADTVFDHALGDEGGGLFCGCGWEPVDPEGFEDWCGHVAAEIVKALTEHAQKRPEGARSDEQPAPAGFPTPEPAGPPEGRYRVGRSYGIHVYEGDRPVATFHDPAEAKRFVDAANGSMSQPSVLDARHLRSVVDTIKAQRRADEAARLAAEAGATLARVQALLDRWNDGWEDGKPVALRQVDELEEALYGETPPVTDDDGELGPQDMPTRCALCGKDPADGLASIGDQRYCHGEEQHTCYERMQFTLGLKAWVDAVDGGRWQVRKARHRRELAWEAFNRRDVFPSRHATQPEALAYADRRARGAGVSDQPPFTITLTAGEPRKAEDPCPECHRWTLWHIPVLIVSEHGLSEAGHVELCELCDTEEDQ